jgi:hypothetical protein
MGYYLFVLKYLKSIQYGALIFIDLLGNNQQFQCVFEYYPELKSTTSPENSGISMRIEWLREFIMGILIVMSLGYLAWLTSRLF